MARKSKKTRHTTNEVNLDHVAQALAKTVCDGDIVNFRVVFSPFSPARETSSESFETDKYAYLLPDEALEDTPRYKSAMQLVRSPFTWDHIKKELEAPRPAQLPADLLLELADNAVREGKYTSAAQAYELLRVRERMQETFFEEADEALRAGDIERGAWGYRIGAALAYEYAAFPEPLPMVEDFQTRALMLHGERPERIEDCISMQPPDVFMKQALTFLLGDADAAARLDAQSMETRLGIFKSLVLQRDPQWDDYVVRYGQACKIVRDFASRIERANRDKEPHQASLVEDIEEQLGEDPRTITATLLGRTIEDGEWWQYLKELAYQHPAAPLFVARQAIGEIEILVPRLRGDSPVPHQLGLTAQAE